MKVWSTVVCPGSAFYREIDAQLNDISTGSSVVECNSGVIPRYLIP